MPEKKYSLTKKESDRLSRLLNVAVFQEEIFQAVQERYRLYLVGQVFKRLSIKPEMLRNSKVDLGSGQLIIGFPDKPKKEKNAGNTKKPAGVQGK